jgi:hypothetical protein
VSILDLAYEHGQSIRGSWQGTDLFEYVYLPAARDGEAPRPYFHPLRTLGGRVVSLLRPHDHPWQQGLCWAPAGDAVRHEGFDLMEFAAEGVLRFDERLTWPPDEGGHRVEELRRVGIAVLPESGAWQLAFESTLHNVAGESVEFSAQRAEDVPNGFFWRGPREFADGAVITPEGVDGAQGADRPWPWLGYAGRHDGGGASSTVVFRPSPDHPGDPVRWFARTVPYAALCPVPFPEGGRVLAAGESLTFGYDVFVIEDAQDPKSCAALLDASPRLLDA